MDALVLSLLPLALINLSINLYFLSFLIRIPAWLQSPLTRISQACGIDSEVCQEVAQTPYARIFGGLSNVWLGLGWNVLLLSFCGVYFLTGDLILLLPCLLVAGASVVVGAYLIYVLRRVLRKPCRL